MTQDAIYQNHQLVALYDALNPAGADTAFYEKIAKNAPSVLDVGCGTGLLTVRLAQQGKDVTGLDPAEEMLAIARKRPAGELVTWLQGDARSLTLDRTFDLVIMTGHVFQVFLSNQDIKAVFTNIFSMLAPGGKLVFETRNPAAKPWLNWNPEKTRKTINLENIGPVTIEHDLQWIEDDKVCFHTHHYFPKTTSPMTNESILRFAAQNDIEDLLSECGFSSLHWQGDWDGSPVTDDSPELIVQATRPEHHPSSKEI